MKSTAVLFALVLCSLAPTRALAAESYDNCTGFVDSLPATISTQGTWCLRKDLATAMTSGAAIIVTANNVTLDCNGFKIGGLAAGISTNAYGISAAGPHNITVRGCNLRGFMIGFMITAGSAHLLEDNRLDNMTFIGMVVGGEGSLVRRNRVLDTGGRPDATSSSAINATGDVIDNIVDGVIGDAGDTTYGVRVDGLGSRVRGNTIRGLVPGEGGIAVGIDVAGGEMQVEDNNIVSGTDVSGIGIWGASGTVCTGNKVLNFLTPLSACTDSVGNITH